MLSEEQIIDAAKKSGIVSILLAPDLYEYVVEGSEIVAFARAIEARVIAQIKDREISDRIKAVCNCYGVGGRK